MHSLDIYPTGNDILIHNLSMGPERTANLNFRSMTRICIPNIIHGFDMADNLSMIAGSWFMAQGSWVMTEKITAKRPGPVCVCVCVCEGGASILSLR